VASSRLDLKRFIRDIPDFPEAGILFRDITPLLRSPEAFRAVIEALAGYVEARAAEAVVGIESRGFLFGTPVAERLGLPFVPIRKPGKLPAAHMSVEYALEYGAGQLDIHSDALAPRQSAVIIDDLLATGGTAEGSARLVEMLGARVAGIAFVIELAGLGGRSRLAGYDVVALLPLE
jgi:adenine phosphoribosyltransferase